MWSAARHWRETDGDQLALLPGPSVRPHREPVAGPRPRRYPF